MTATLDPASEATAPASTSHRLQGRHAEALITIGALLGWLAPISSPPRLGPAWALSTQGYALYIGGPLVLLMAIGVWRMWRSQRSTSGWVLTIGVCLHMQRVVLGAESLITRVADGTPRIGALSLWSHAAMACVWVGVVAVITRNRKLRTIDYAHRPSWIAALVLLASVAMQWKSHREWSDLITRPGEIFGLFFRSGAVAGGLFDPVLVLVAAGVALWSAYRCDVRPSFIHLYVLCSLAPGFAALMIFGSRQIPAAISFGPLFAGLALVTLVVIWITAPPHASEDSRPRRKHQPTRATAPTPSREHKPAPPARRPRLIAAPPSAPVASAPPPPTAAARITFERPEVPARTAKRRFALMLGVQAIYAAGLIAFYRAVAADDSSGGLFIFEGLVEAVAISMLALHALFVIVTLGQWFELKHLTRRRMAIILALNTAFALWPFFLI